ncbi:hypothetical protein EJV47_04445 [Hymenobacter gummosus]|uniref:Carboxypeptidase regulatory-like domain-containing protein n=1 Tax=Hymenobacter gummosus TaxID=1776032 RepID=A0A3S0IQU5_9BACT|nr:carboxypeptidase regulatory-like domain-containing protein [Hymenobacter gummosus]RTQ52280.1 hypothetical protein EJV47_04445 [Hymenobacter gummosus]
MKTSFALRFFFAALALALVTMYAPAAGRKAAAQGQLTGALFDGATHEPIPLANVVLLRAADGAYVATAATRPDGTFEFRNVPLGQYRVQTTVLGYEPLRPVVGLTAQQPQKALGAVELTPFGAAVACVPPATRPASTAAKVGNAGRYVLTVARLHRRQVPRIVQL